MDEKLWHTFPMKVVIGSFILSLLMPLSSLAQGFYGSLDVEVHPWTSECVSAEDGFTRCTPPTPTQATPGHVSLQIKETSGPGSADRSSAVISWDSHGPAGWVSQRLMISVYSIEPYLNSGRPPYLQLKAELAGAVQMVCAQSVKWRVPMEIPPLVCAADTEIVPHGSGKTLRYGVTLVPLWFK